MEDARLVDGMTPEEFAEVQRVHQVMLKAMDKELWQLAQFMVTRRDDQLLGETEFAVRDKVLRMGAQALGATIDDRKKGLPRQQHRLLRLRSGRPFPWVADADHRQCDGTDLRSRRLLLLSALPSWPQALGTPVAAEADHVDSGVGGDRFVGWRVGQFCRRADRVLQKMAGLRLSESTVERTTEATGQRVRQQLDEGKSLGPTRPWQWQRDARGQCCAYIGLDATGVRQQGPGGHHAEGRMAYVGMVYNPRSQHDPQRPPPRQVRYLSGFFELDSLGRQLHREALEVGWAEADQHIALSDGGVGLEQFFKRFFPKAVCILDFFHAKEYLVELGQSLYGEDDSARQAWLDDMCHRLKHEGGPTVRRQLEDLDLATASAAVREVHRKTVQYFRNHEHRMDYPTYVRNGWQIGSGPVESACKTVVGNRLKGGGMRWGEDGSDAVCHLRALYLSEPACWESFWNPSPN